MLYALKSWPSNLTLFTFVSHEGQVKKSLSVTPLGNDSGYFLNISKWL